MSKSILQSAFDAKSTSTTVPLDPTLLDDLEKKALNISITLNEYLSKLRSKMHDMSLSTYQSVHIHAESIQELCNETESATQRALEMINAVDELSHDMNGVMVLSEQIESIRASLEWLESVVDQTTNESNFGLSSTFTQIMSGVFGSK
ncbi:hypothetical protein HK098_006655 [Nowakowskiella sp. JEL0407]|nr:hypothetical protein HK098_006655 [Nowakowskiella sp. JEL0407]